MLVLNNWIITPVVLFLMELKSLCAVNNVKSWELQILLFDYFFATNFFYYFLHFFIVKFSTMISLLTALNDEN